MNSKVLLFVLLSLLIVFSACDKSEDVEPGNNIPLIKTITYYSDGVFWYSKTFEYNQSGKLTKETYDDETYYTYSYETGKIIKKKYNKESSLTSTDTLLLNKEGLLISEGKTTYEYDTNGYLVKSTAPFEPPSNYFITSYKISNGNIAQKTISYSPVIKKGTYKYLADKNTIGNENMGKPWLGKQDKNLPSEDYWVSTVEYQTWESTMYYTYEMDSENRVTKKTGNQDTRDGREYYITYTYY